MVQTCTQPRWISQKLLPWSSGRRSSMIKAVLSLPGDAMDFTKPPLQKKFNVFQTLKRWLAHGISNLSHRCCMTATQGPPLKSPPDRSTSVEDCTSTLRTASPPKRSSPPRFTAPAGAHSSYRLCKLSAMQCWLRFMFLVAATHSEKNTHNQYILIKRRKSHNSKKLNNFHKDSLLLMDHRCLGVTRVRFAVQDQKAGVRTLSRLTLRRSYHAVPVTCSVRRRGHRCVEQLLLLLLGVSCDCSLVVGC